MKLPLISHRKHERLLEAEIQKAVDLMFHSQALGVTSGMEAIERWLKDSRSKAEELRREEYKNAPETWHVGWVNGQEWINEAMEDLANRIEERKSSDG